jgi:hypothetical protein
LHVIRPCEENHDSQTKSYAFRRRASSRNPIIALGEDAPSHSTHYDYGVGIRTTNIIERLFGEFIKLNHKMAAAFRNESGSLLMFYALIRSLKLRRITIPAKVAEP